MYLKVWNVLKNLALRYRGEIQPNAAWKLDVSRYMLSSTHGHVTALTNSEMKLLRVLAPRVLPLSP